MISFCSSINPNLMTLSWFYLYSGLHVSLGWLNVGHRFLLAISSVLFMLSWTGLYFNVSTFMKLFWNLKLNTEASFLVFQLVLTSWYWIWLPILICLVFSTSCLQFIFRLRSSYVFVSNAVTESMTHVQHSRNCKINLV